MGGGSVAQAKLAQLVAAGAAIHVVALSISEGVAALARRHPDLVRLERRAVALADLEGVRLAISATNDPALNARLAEAARRRGLWFNAVDDARSCEFFFAARLQRGPLHVAIGTEGAFPGLSGAFRAFLEELIPEGDGDLLLRLADLRLQIRRTLPDPAQRTRSLRRVLEALKADYFRALGALAELS